MSTLQATMVLIGGLVLLVGGAEGLVRAGSRLGLHYGLRPIMIGATILAFGTSAPEMVVSLLGEAKGETGMALGTVAGSNVANLALVLGAAALLRPLPIAGSVLRIEYLAMVFATAIVTALAWDGEVSKQDGLILLGTFVVLFVPYVIRALRATDTYGDQSPEEQAARRHPRPALLWLGVVIGLACLSYGADLVVSGASELARVFGMPQSAIAATLVAGGTSLPELATSVVAAIKKEDEIAVGNVLGSNVFNLLFVIGPTASLYPLSMGDAERELLIPAMVVVAVLMLPLFLTRRMLGRIEGFALLTVYGTFLFLIIQRGGVG